MKIIYAHNFYQQPGGEDQSFRAQVALLQEHGHAVFTFARDNAEINRLNPLTAAARTIWSREAASALDALIRRTGAELVHFHNTFMLISPAAYYAAKARGLPVVQDLRNYRLICPAATLFRDGHVCEDCLGKAVPWPAVLHACWRDSRPQSAVVAGMLATHRALGTWRNRVDRYIALTEFARQKFIQGGLPAERIAVKPNFVAAAPSASRRREDYALFVGRLDAPKGITTLLDAWERLKGLDLKIVGDGPMRDPVVAFSAARQGVKWLGQLPHAQVLDLMARARLLVVPSLWYEGMPNTILEAFSSGLPVAASRLGAMAETIQDRENGLLFTPGDANSLAAVVTWAQAHQAELESIGKAGHASYQQFYSPDKSYEQLMEIYKQAKSLAT